MFDDILNQIIIAIIIIGIIIYLYFQYAESYKLNTDRLQSLALMKFRMSEFSIYDKYKTVKVKSLMVNNGSVDVVFECDLDDKIILIARSYILDENNCKLTYNDCIDPVMYFNK